MLPLPLALIALQASADVAAPETVTAEAPGPQAHRPIWRGAFSFDDSLGG
jgi:hypothetical protein